MAVFATTLNRHQGIVRPMGLGQRLLHGWLPLLKLRLWAYSSSADFHRRLNAFLDARLLSQYARTSAANRKEVKSQHQLSEKLGESSDYTKRVEAKNYRHTVLMDKLRVTVVRILETADFPVSSTGTVDFEKGGSQISLDTVEKTTNYHIEIVTTTRANNVVVDVGLTSDLRQRVKGSGRYHWNNKVQKGVKVWKEVRGEYPRTVKVVFIGGHLSVPVQRDLEKVLSKTAQMIAPATMISGKNVRDNLPTMLFPHWVIAGVPNLGAGPHLSKIGELPECRGPSENELAGRFQKVYDYTPKPNKKS